MYIYLLIPYFQRLFANATKMSYCPESYREATMNTKEELQTRLDKLRREYRGVRSMIEMMQKGTDVAALRKLREEKLDPIGRQIREVEATQRGPEICRTHSEPQRYLLLTEVS